MPNKNYAEPGDKLLMLWTVLAWALLMLQTPPIDPGFFGQWEQVGIVGILIAVIAFGSWFLMRQLRREIARADKLDEENVNLVRQNERMSLEAIGAVRELSAELKTLLAKVEALERQIALLLARLDR